MSTFELYVEEQQSHCCNAMVKNLNSSSATAVMESRIWTAIAHAQIHGDTKCDIVFEDENGEIDRISRGRSSV